MQDNVVKRYRARLLREGYTNVCITDYSERGFYFVSCVSPLGIRISTRVSCRTILVVPRRVYFPDIELSICKDTTL